MKICPKCGSINGDGSNNCTKCGSALGASQRSSAGQNINQRRHSSTPPQPQRPTYQQQPTQRQTGNPGYAPQQQQQIRQPQSPPSPPRTPQNNYKKNGSSSNNKLFLIFGSVAVLIFIICGAFFTIGNSTMTESEINKDYGSGVVLIMNSGYYEVVLSNGESVYFSSYDPKNGLENFTFDSDSIVTQTAFGTGFLISSDGKIATNNHLVASDVTEKEINRQMSSVFDRIKQTLSEKYSEYKAYDQQLIAQIREKYLYDQDYSQEYALSESLEAEMEKLKQMYNYLDDINPSNSEIKYHSTISIAYNDTYITNTSDFIPCILKATDTDYDLAIIQLKDKKTPTDKHVFEVPSENMLQTYSFGELLAKSIGKDKNEKLVMIGFNHGTELAFTKEGINAQCTSGSISQNDADKIMYTIPALHGSSGSPVLNQKGQLIAINFAGIDVTQSFNYGVKAKHLYDLLNR